MDTWIWAKVNWNPKSNEGNDVKRCCSNRFSCGSKIYGTSWNVEKIWNYFFQNYVPWKYGGILGTSLLFLIEVGDRRSDYEETGLRLSAVFSAYENACEFRRWCFLLRLQNSPQIISVHRDFLSCKIAFSWNISCCSSNQLPEQFLISGP